MNNTTTIKNSTYSKPSGNTGNMATKKESAIQAECFQWHWNNYPNERMQLFMVYNNGKNAAHGNILKAMGMVAGVSDMIYLAPLRKAGNVGIQVYSSTIAFLECKRPGETQSDAQIDFEAKAKALGYDYHIFRSLEEFQEIMSRYH